VGNLSAFLDAMKAGKVEPGSALIVESVDRISRQGIDEGYDLCKRILKAGVRLVTLSPEREYDAGAVKKLSAGALELLLILERAAEESETKSERVGSAWSRKKRNAHGGPITRMVPAWVKVQGGRLVAIPERVAAIKRIFQLSAAGYGELLICRRLTDEGVPAIGGSGRWNKAYVAKLLRDRRALGEYQPRRRQDGRPDGDPVPGYFPAVITPDEWDACRTAARVRRKKPGRLGKHVNLFQGLLRDARTGGAYFATSRLNGKRTATHMVLINGEAAEGRAARVTLPADAFERAVLSQLSEINPREILPTNGSVDTVAALSTEQAAASAELAEAKAFMDGRGFSATIGQRIIDLEERLKVLGPKLDEARQKARHPVGEAWGEYKGLLQALDNAADPMDARLRLRTVLRRMVAEIWLLVVPRGRDRLAATQLWFSGSAKHRDYLIYCRPTRANRTARREGYWRSLSLADVAGPDDFDLRRRSDAKALQRLLQDLDLAELGK
jgi:DNA invertase Pin-like site-specific DNA recombinase